MKKIIIASGVLALMAAATSCDTYDIYPEQYGDIMMIKDAGEHQITIYATEAEAPYYISVMKGGHDPEKHASATLKIMSDAEFGEYKEKYYGNAEFEGLQPLKPEFYHLADADMGVVTSGAISYNFGGSSDRYFGANVVLDAQMISDWRESLESRANIDMDEVNSNPDYTEEEKAKFQKDRDEARDTINNFTFVVPVGLYSETDSVNADNYAVMVQPVVENPVLSVSVDHDGYSIYDLSRVELTENDEFRAGTLNPEDFNVTLSIPCENEYGFQVRFRSLTSYVATFNEAHSDTRLTALRNSADQTLYELGTKDEATGEVEQVIDFPAGVTEVKLPLTLFLSEVNENDLSSNMAVGIQLQPSGLAFDAETDEPVERPRPSDNVYRPDMLWPNENTPPKVKKALKLPTASNNVYNSTNYTFFVGYRVVETPLTLDDGCVTSPDMEPSEGSIAALFDDDLSTFFHSKWSVDPERSAPFASYLEIEVPSRTAINSCYFQFTARSGTSAAPTEVDLYYSNEDDIQLRELEESWTKFATVKLPRKLNAGETGELGSLDNMATAPETFKYLRFCVMKSSLPSGAEADLTLADKTQYWNLAELRMYGKYVAPANAQ